MGEKYCADKGEWYASAKQARNDGTTRIDQDELIVRLNKCGWAGARDARKWAAGTEQCDLHTCNLTGAMRRKNEHGPFGPMS